MRFRYISLPRAEEGVDLPRPILRANIVGRKRQLPIRMLVDSGSDETLFPTGLLGFLDAPITAEKARLSSFSGAEFEGGVSQVRIQFGCPLKFLVGLLVVTAPLQCHTQLIMRGGGRGIGIDGGPEL